MKITPEILRETNINYFLCAFYNISVKPDFKEGLPIIQDCTKSLVNVWVGDANLKSIKEVVGIVDAFAKLWEVRCLKQEDLKKIFGAFETSMDKRSNEMRQDFTGKQFATIVRLISYATTNRIFQFQHRGFDRCREIFLNADYTNFSITDLFNILDGMKTFPQTKMPVILDKVVQLTPAAIKSHDSDFLELF